MKRIIRLASRGESDRSSFKTHKKWEKVLKKEGFTLLYLGHAVLSDARASSEVTLAIMAVKQSPTDQKIVQIYCQGPQLYVKENVGEEGEQEMLTSPLTNISQCLQHTAQGFNDCFGLVFSSGPWIKQCHIFQAKTSKEASDVVLSIHRSVKAVIKSYRRKSEIPISALLLESPQTSQNPNNRIHQRRKSDSGLRTVTSEPTPLICVTGADASPIAPLAVPMHKSSPWKLRKKEGKEMSRSEKIEVVSESCKAVKESNELLRQACNNPHPQSPFERALHAINFTSDQLLSHLLDQHMLSIDACDHDGNTPLHYAVAMKNNKAIEILHERMASLEHPNNNKLHPLHRAVSDGNKHVITRLLERGANPNALDAEKNTPLHYSASSREQHEICWILLQYGGMIQKQNRIGIRPIDMLPDLKEMQNRLIVSMCKSFCDPKEKLVPPMTASAALSPPGLLPDSLNDFLERAKEQAKSFKSKIRGGGGGGGGGGGTKHNKFKKISRSISNLSELLEADEDEMIRQDRLQKLKFPFQLPVDYLQLEADKEVVEKEINKLIHFSKNSRRTLKRSTSDPEFSSVAGDMNDGAETETKDFDFNKILKHFEPREIPPPSPLPPPYRFGSRERMKRENETTPDATLSAAFDGLESELEQITSDHRKSSPALPQIKISPKVPRRFTSMTHASDSKRDERDQATPTLEPKSKDEAMAELDDLIHQMESDIKEMKPFVMKQQRKEEEEEREDAKSTGGQRNKEAEQSRGRSPSGNNQPQHLLSPVQPPGGSKRREGGEGGRGYHQTITSSLEVTDSCSSSDTRNQTGSSFSPSHPLMRKGHRRIGSTGSTLSMGSSSSSSNPLPLSESLLNFPMDSEPGEPGANSLHVLCLLSQNSECIQPLISHICLSDFKERLVGVASAESSSLSTVSNIANLVHNIFEMGGPDGRKAAVESGMMDIVLKLLSTRDPIPGTCLMILDHLLVNEGDNNYLRTIAKIPCAPLLTFLEHSDPDLDSGLGSQRERGPSSSSTTTFEYHAPSSSHGSHRTPPSHHASHHTYSSHGSHLTPSSHYVQSSSSHHSPSHQGDHTPSLHHPFAPHHSTRHASLPHQGDERTVLHHQLLTNVLARDRATSFTSESSSANSIASPTFQGDMVTNQEAKRIVLKLLAVTSSHTKMQRALSSSRYVSLLSDYTSDVSLENRTNAIITLANIGQDVQSHAHLLQAGLVEKLRPVLSNGPKARYHAIRALVYLGKLQLFGCNLFSNGRGGGEDESEYVIKTVDGHGHTYARGLTMEASIELLTSSTRELWGGITLRDTESGLHLSREKTTDFFLTTYRSFLHPLILMRLLLHRLDMPNLDINPFDWSKDVTDVKLHSSQHIQAIPPVHQATLSIIGQWMETYQEDFRYIPQLQDYLGELIHRLRKFKGVYTPHAHRLKSLLHDLQKPPPSKRTGETDGNKSLTTSLSASDIKYRIPHHENLYFQCKKLISEDLLPVTLDTAIHLAGLQLHIETLVDNTLNQAFMEGAKSKKESRTYINHLKNALPAWCFRMKNISKKVRDKLSEFEGLSDRNAKHMYIEKCQSSPGYHCTFYNVKVPMEGKFRRGHYSQLLGISDHQMVFLEEKTRELASVYPLHDIQNVQHLPSDPCSLIIHFSTGQKVPFSVERESFARQIEIVLDNLGQKVLHDIEKEDLQDWWGQSPSSIQNSAGLTQDISQSSESSPPVEGFVGKSPSEFEETLTPVPREGAEGHDLTTPTTIKAIGTPNPLTPINDGGVIIHRNTSENNKSYFPYPEVIVEHHHHHQTSHPLFCDCPPDPEIPLHIDIRLLSLQEILMHPVEVARQVTLIDHEKLCAITREELLQRAGLYPRSLIESMSATTSSSHNLVSPSLSSMQSGNSSESGIELLAQRFNQLCNWTVHSVLQYSQEEDRGWVIQQFITTAKSCLEYKNYSSTMAIILGLCSPSIRRLKQTWQHVGKTFKDGLDSMTELLSSRNNYKNYREAIEKTATPAVPYFGIFTRDLTFIIDGNPDFLHNLVNLHKRRQLYAKLEEIRHFQGDRYKFEPVPALQDLLTQHVPVNEDDLHALSHSLEPPIQEGGGATPIEGRLRSGSVSSLTNLGFLKQSFSSRTSGSSSNLLSI